MKKLFTLVTLLFSLSVMSAPTPFSPAAWEYLKVLDSGASNGPVVEKASKFTWEISSTVASGSTVQLEGEIPKGALVTEVIYYVADDFESANSNTVAIGCDSTNDILTATSLDGSATGTVAKGAADGAAANFVYIDAVCNPVVTVGSGASGITRGKLIGWIRYLLAE